MHDPGLPYGAAVRGGAHSNVPAFSRFWRDRFAVIEELGVYIVKRVLFLFHLPRILWSGNIFGGWRKAVSPIAAPRGPVFGHH